MVPAPAAIQVQSHQPTRTTKAESGRILSRSYGGQYYQITLIYNLMKRSEAGPLIAFLQSRKGRDSIFRVEVSGFADVPGTEVANFANFDDDTKLHLITSTTPSIEVTPPARAAGSILYTDTVFMRASLAGDAQIVSIERNALVRLEINLVERL